MVQLAEIACEVGERVMCKKVWAFLQQKLNGLWAITVYNSPYTCPSIGVNKDGRMMDSNFLAQELHKYVLEDHTCKIKDL